MEEKAENEETYDGDEEKVEEEATGAEPMVKTTKPKSGRVLCTASLIKFLFFLLQELVKMIEMCNVFVNDREAI